MNITDILTSALVCLSLVFTLLGGLFVLVQLSSSVIRLIDERISKRAGE